MTGKYEVPSALTVYPTGLQEISAAYSSKGMEEISARDCGGACPCSGGGPHPCACRC